MAPTDYSKSKYQDAIAEAAEAIVNEGMADETIGSVSEWPFEHYALVTLDADTAELIRLAWDAEGRANDERAETLLIGSRVIIRTDEQGFVWTFYGPAHPLGDPGAYRSLMSTWDELVRGMDQQDEPQDYD